MRPPPAIYLRTTLTFVQVDTVDDSLKLPCLVLDDVVEAPAALGRLNLPRVPLAHRDQPVCELDARLHDVHVLATDWVVEAEHLVIVLGDLELPDVVHRAPALVRNVVQHKDGPRERHLAVVPVVRLQVEGQQGSVPGRQGAEWVRQATCVSCKGRPSSRRQASLWAAQPLLCGTCRPR